MRTYFPFSNLPCTLSSCSMDCLASMRATCCVARTVFCFISRPGDGTLWKRVEIIILITFVAHFRTLVFSPKSHFLPQLLVTSFIYDVSKRRMIIKRSSSFISAAYFYSKNNARGISTWFPTERHVSGLSCCNINSNN